MAVLINSPALFYMATAMVATILACRLQAWLAVRGLHIERVIPPAVHSGDLVTVSMTVVSDHRTKRPLITVYDQLPERLITTDRSPSLPVAPSFDQPIQTRYSFRPARRGKYRWSTVVVFGTDALGLVTMARSLRTEPTELIVYPARIPTNLGLRPAGGSGGFVESDTGKFRGSGLEPRGIREYAPGDPLRSIHWLSSARGRSIMVKEFEVGSDLSASIFIQREAGTEVGKVITTLEAMCGHWVYLCEEFLKMGATLEFPALGLRNQPGEPYGDKIRRINEVLAEFDAPVPVSVAQEIRECAKTLAGTGTVYVSIAVADPELPEVLAKLDVAETVCLVYDPLEFDPQSRVKPALDPDFLANLRMAGTKVVLMPPVVALP